MGAEYVTVPIDDHGLNTDYLEAALRSGPKFMYILPNFQNPGGVTLSEDRRHELVLLSDKYGIPIIEDDPYGQLRYEGEHKTPLVVLDRPNMHSDSGYTLGNVIYLSTFSKLLAPGMRVAWIVAPPDVIARLSQLKQSTDLHTSTFAQMVTYEVARDGFLDEHVKLIRKCYSERKDAMLKALTDYFPEEVTWTRSARRPLPVGDAANRHQHAQAARPGLAQRRRVRSRRPVLPRWRHGVAYAAELLQRYAGDDPRRRSPAVDCGGPRAGAC